MSFKFNFTAPPSTDEAIGEVERAICKKPRDLIEARELKNSEAKGISKDTNFDSVFIASGIILKKGLVDGQQASEVLKDNDLAASDLVAGKYEGGFKLWECGIDLARYLAELWALDKCENKLVNLCGREGLSSSRALELGCGHGLPGIVAAMAGMQVHFQDYNSEVLTKLTAPNYARNVESTAADWAAQGHPRFFYGGWSSFKDLLLACELRGTYDYIFSSDSIYSLDSQEDLLDCIVESLRVGGRAYIAAKIYYFGVGGSSQAFKNLARRRGILDVEDVVTFDDGASNKREIFCLTRV